jgi:hypothetical protein
MKTSTKYFALGTPQCIAFTLVSIALLVGLLVLLIGCEDGLRFAPSESLKQVAELTHDLAAKINAEGTSPGSPASERVMTGARASLLYMGRPKAPAEIEQFDTVTAQAITDAAKRPDPWQVADSALELGIGIAALFAGAAVLKRQSDEVSHAFKEAQVKQSPSTRVLVTKIRAG